MKKLLLSGLVAGMLATSASAWDFCSDESQIGIAAGGMGAGVLIADATFGGVPGLIAGAILNHLLCDPVATDNHDEVKTLVDAPLKAVSISDAKTVYFGFDKYDLDANAKEAVKTTAGVLKAIPNQAVRIEGNADSRGSDEYNYALGLKRANAVKAALVNEDVKNQLDVVSYGEAQPACEGATEDCFAQNRRVEFKTVK